MNVLIVEDDIVQRDLWEQVFTKAGATVLLANHGAEALKQMMDGKLPDAMIADINMPVMNGVELVQHARRLPGGNKIIIIVLTANPHMIMQHNLEDIAEVVMYKPVHYREVVTLAQRLVANQLTPQ